MRVALAQRRPLLGDKAANVAIAEQCIVEAAAAHADLVLFPELFLTGYSTRQHTRELAEPPDGPSLKTLAELARSHRIAAVVGFPEADRTSDAVYNSTCLISARGELAGCYRKVHLFGEERRYFAAGNRHLVANVAGCRVGLMICYDIEFPEMARLAALGGAQILLVSSANMSPYEEYQRVYLKARALENHAFVLLANRVGTEDEFRFFGGSAGCDPFGCVLCRAGEEETLLVADLDPTLAEKSRRLFDYIAERRPMLYGPLAQPDGAGASEARSRRTGSL